MLPIAELGRVPGYIPAILGRAMQQFKLSKVLMILFGHCKNHEGFFHFLSFYKSIETLLREFIIE